MNRLEKLSLAASVMMLLLTGASAQEFTVDSQSEWNEGEFVDTTATSDDFLTLQSSSYEVDFRLAKSGGDVYHAPSASDGDFVYKLNAGDQELRKIDPEDGQTIETLDNDFRTHYESEIILGSDGYLYIPSEGSIRKIDPENMEEVNGNWPFTSGNDYITSISTDDELDYLVASDDEGNVYRIDLQTGNTEFFHDGSGDQTRTAVNSDGDIYVSDSRDVNHFDENLNPLGNEYSGDSRVHDIETDNDGNPIVAVGETNNADESYIKKFEKDLDEIWEQNSAHNDVPRDIDINSENNIYSALIFDGDKIVYTREDGEVLAEELVGDSTTGVEAVGLDAIVWAYVDSSEHDLIRLDTTHIDNGLYRSEVYDSGEDVLWQELEVTASLNGGSGEVSVQYSDDDDFSSVDAEEEFQLQDGTEDYSPTETSEYVRLVFDLETNGSPPEVDQFILEGDPDYLRSEITSPDEGSWQQGDFNVEVEDDFESGDECEYRITDDGVTGSWQDRTCDQEFTVDADVCENEDRNTCLVETRVASESGETDSDERYFSIGESPCPDAEACYLMNSGEGQSVFDYSPNLHDGYRGSEPQPDDDEDPEWISDCPDGYCLEFDGLWPAEHRVTVPDVSAGDSQEFTVRVDYNEDFRDDSQASLVYRNESFILATDNETGYLMGTIWNEGECGGWCGDETPPGNSYPGGANWFVTGYNVSDLEDWNKLSMDWNGTRTRFYVNSLKVYETGSSKVSQPTQVNRPDTELWFGAGRAGEYYTHGALDNVELYNDVFLDGDIVCREEMEGVYYNALPDDSNRLKQDAEVCQEVNGEFIWMDQDYSEDLCRDGTWISQNEVENNPHAFTEGISDDDRESLPTDYESRPNQNTWSGDETPVSTGNYPEDTGIATEGFCLGDDASENLITQDCNSQYCPTRDSVKGAAIDTSSCVLDGSEVPLSSSDDFDDHRVFHEGEELELQDELDSSLACFGGSWYSDWPVAFDSSSVDMDTGEERISSFKIINTRDRTVEYTVSLEDTDMSDFAEFVDRDDSFRITVEPRSSIDIPLRVQAGATEVNDGTLRVRAESTLDSFNDVAEMTVNVVDVDREVQRREVPGLSTLGIFLLIVSGLMVYLF